MKGGGFIVFLFLLVCFLWGVTSIVGGIRRRMQAWTTPEPSPPQPADETELGLDDRVVAVDVVGRAQRVGVHRVLLVVQVRAGG